MSSNGEGLNEASETPTFIKMPLSHPNIVLTQGFICHKSHGASAHTGCYPNGTRDDLFEYAIYGEMELALLEIVQENGWIATAEVGRCLCCQSKPVRASPDWIVMWLQPEVKNAAL